jgi:RNA-directed DNA polymerase
MRTRFEPFSLEILGDKTRPLEFGRYAMERPRRSGQGKLQTLSFLGLRFICGRSRRGAFRLRRHTRRDRMRVVLQEVKHERRRRRHGCVADQDRWLRSGVTGCFAYRAVPTNPHAIGACRHHAIELWLRSLRRRSQKHGMTWARIDRLAAEWLPPTHVPHPWPEDRLAVKHPR